LDTVWSKTLLVFLNQDIEEVAFIIHENFGKSRRELSLSLKSGCQRRFITKTSVKLNHFIMCAKFRQDLLHCAYADTFTVLILIWIKMLIIIWVQQVDQPEAFG
jgi:glucose-1-phosphate thymidylyltransferase